MLLTRLVEHAPHLDLPPVYYRHRRVRWVLSLDAQGRVKSVDSAGHPTLGSLADGENRHGIELATPYIYRSGAKPPPMLLVDTLQYVLAMPVNDSDKAEAEAIRCNDAYIALLEQWFEHAPDESTAAAVLAFFRRQGHLNVTIPEDAKPSDTLALRVEGQWAHEADSASSVWRTVVAQRKGSDTGKGVCLACGQEGALLDTIPEPVKAGAIPVPTGRGRDTVLVSVNKSAQGRGGRIQLADIPICAGCGSTATAVLNSLLATNEHRYRTSDSVTVWWLKRPTQVSLLRSLREARPEDIGALFAELDQPRTGLENTRTDPNAFYAVTLSANQSRVVVRDWLDVPLTDALTHARTWFEDHQIQDVWQTEPQHVALWRMARCLGRWKDDDTGKGYAKDSEPKTAERTLLSMALHGEHYRPPVFLLQRLDQRIGADGHLDLPRMALLKLLLLRLNPQLRETVMPTLNDNDDHPAVLCGRLFATFEQIQYQALRDPATKKGPNTTVTDKYFTAAKARPLSVMEMVRDTANAHLKRLKRDSPGAWGGLSNRLDVLYTRLGGAPPATLNLEGRALFTLGYHQQRADDRAAAAKAKEDKAVKAAQDTPADETE
ncbi:type I-C CRISPR-associated protein Cas8c/Csd1 [Nocardiopsis sp. YSL2]|uniref:type I-C CRISPR-associated protein Cas8c/Csd1 n=1 Tax=Nocardiopsis sp. YSL2 TaxID=2939492 RepID=UPI0026F41675|nr:type I-C CRISPR-associated protein Cas8c/Csd1 [Nocardiopsis sp. YSL2]